MEDRPEQKGNSEASTTLTLKVEGGDDIKTVAQQMIEEAEKTGKIVKTQFNKVELMATDASDAKDIVAYYEKMYEIIDKNKDNSEISFKQEGGDELEKVAEQMINLAKITGKPVKTEFNKVQLMATNESNVKDIEDAYDAYFKK